MDKSNCVCRTFCKGIPKLSWESFSRAKMHSSALCLTCGLNYSHSHVVQSTVNNLRSPMSGGTGWKISSWCNWNRQFGTRVRYCTSHLFFSECEFVLSLLQRSVVHPLFHQAFWACGTLLGGTLVCPLRLSLLTKIIRCRSWLIPASRHAEEVSVKPVILFCFLLFRSISLSGSVLWTLPGLTCAQQTPR